jgi:hypothetical protein
MPAPVRATQLRPRSSAAAAVTAAGAATVTQVPYRARSIPRNSVFGYESLAEALNTVAQLMVPVPLSRRAASAIEPVIEGYTVNDSET